MTGRLHWLALVLLVAAPVPAQPTTLPASNPNLRTLEAKYYLIHSDLGPPHVREADIRTAKMAEEYARRTKEFAGRVDRKFPFFLFTREKDYLAAGGVPGSVGVFDRKTGTLMAVAGPSPNEATWHTVQHEGFHQFAAAVIGGELPMWVNEGLADYFGEGVFTGDGFVLGVVPEWRRRRVVRTIEAGKFKPLRALLKLSQGEWNDPLRIENYDQAWSLVHFLVRADGGRDRPAFAAFIRSVAGGEPWERAWEDHLGSIDQLERRWRNYWRKLPPNPTSDLYARATVEKLNSFLARTAVQGQKFETFDRFAGAAAAGRLKIGDADWLPRSLIETALLDAKAMRAAGGQFRIENSAIVYEAAAGGGAVTAGDDNGEPSNTRPPRPGR